MQSIVLNLWEIPRNYLRAADELNAPQPEGGREAGGSYTPSHVTRQK